MSPHLYVFVVRARRALARPAVRRALVALLAAATAVTVISLIEAADAARSRWGDTRPVVVATRDLAPGDVVDAAAVTVRDLPSGLVTDAALASVGPGAVVRHPIVAGEPVVARRLAPDGLTGVAALVPSGQRAVAVPLGPAGGPPLVVGDRVDVIAVLPPGAGSGEGDPEASGGEPAFALAEHALVVDVTDGAVTVAVPRDDVPRVAWALGLGSLVLSLVGG